jgi:LmbE family N-acetylglucosaminyl deacetylase
MPKATPLGKFGTATEHSQMLKLGFQKRSRQPYRILCLGAHSDDIEIGCGGAILELLRTRRDLEFHWVVFSSGKDRDREARRSASLFLKHSAKQEVAVLDFRNSFFPSEFVKIKEYFEGLKTAISPDLILTHARDDLHQDHRVINQLTWNTWRNHFILEYEIPKYDGDLGRPNFFVPFDQKVAALKIKHLMSCFKTQSNKHWFTPDTFQGLMRIRGLEANSSGNFAEAFYARKVILDV